MLPVRSKEGLYNEVVGNACLTLDDSVVVQASGVVSTLLMVGLTAVVLFDVLDAYVDSLPFPSSAIMHQQMHCSCIFRS